MPGRKRKLGLLFGQLALEGNGMEWQVHRSSVTPALLPHRSPGPFRGIPRL